MEFEIFDMWYMIQGQGIRNVGLEIWDKEYGIRDM